MAVPEPPTKQWFWAEGHCTAILYVPRIGCQFWTIFETGGAAAQPHMLPAQAESAAAWCGSDTSWHTCACLTSVAVPYQIVSFEV